MPDTPANQAADPQSRNQRRGVGFPIARVVTIFSLTCAAVLSGRDGTPAGQENRRNHAASAGFGTPCNPATCCWRTACLAVFETSPPRWPEAWMSWPGSMPHGTPTWAAADGWQSTTTSSSGNGRGSTANASRAPSGKRWSAHIEVRELRFRVTQPGFRTQQITLVTTLLDPLADPVEELSALDRERWHCELDLRSLKTSMQMHRLRCKSPEMVEKELWTPWLADNLIRQTMAEAARAHGGLPRQLSFQGAVQMVNAFAGYWPRAGADRQRLWKELLVAIATHRVGDRPNRIEHAQAEAPRAENTPA